MRMRTCRLVRIWKICRGHSAITATTRSMKASGTASWNRSPIELTNTRLGLRQASGASSTRSTQATLPVHRPRALAPPGPTRSTSP